LKNNYKDNRKTKAKHLNLKENFNKYKKCFSSS
jgi:hypothetical protein